MAEILTVKSLCGVVVVVGWVPVHRLVTATVRFGCDNKKEKNLRELSHRQEIPKQAWAELG